MKRKEYSLGSRLKRGAVAFVTGLASIVSGCNAPQQNADLEALKSMRPETTAVSEEKKEEKEKAVEIYVENTYASNYVAPAGIILGKKDALKRGGVNQGLIDVKFKNGLSAVIWGSYDIQDARTGNGFHEVDFGGFYSFGITKNLSGKVGFWRWEYPSGFVGKYDNLAVAGISYRGKVDASLTFNRLFGHDDTETGDNLIGSVSKTFPIGEVWGKKVSITPGVHAAYLANFFDYTGLSHITPKIGLGIDLGNNTSLNLSVNKQISQMDGIEDHTWYTLSLGKRF